MLSTGSRQSYTSMTFNNYLKREREKDRKTKITIVWLNDTDLKFIVKTISAFEFVFKRFQFDKIGDGVGLPQCGVGVGAEFWKNSGVGVRVGVRFSNARRSCAELERYTDEGVVGVGVEFGKIEWSWSGVGVAHGRSCPSLLVDEADRLRYSSLSTENKDEFTAGSIEELVYYEQDKKESERESASYLDHDRTMNDPYIFSLTSSHHFRRSI